MKPVTDKSKITERHFLKSGKSPAINKKAESESFLEFQRNFISDKNAMDDDDLLNHQEEYEGNTQQKGLSLKYPNNSLINASHIIAKKFINKMKKTANLNNLDYLDAASLLNDLSHVKIIIKKTSKIKRKLIQTIKTILNIILPYIYKGNSKGFFQKTLKIKIIHPFENLKILWDIFILINTLVMFFYIPFTMSFNYLPETERDRLNLMEFIIYVMDILITLNTGCVENGSIIKDRKKILINYAKRYLFSDIFAISSLIAKNDDFYGDHEDPKMFILQFLFFARIKSFRTRFNKIKEYFCLDSKLKGNYIDKTHEIYNFLYYIYNRNPGSFRFINDNIVFFSFFRMFFSSNSFIYSR